MAELAVVGVAFAMTFLAELPDKSMFASLILATRYRPLWVWLGAAAAFAVQMVIAVTAGRLLALLPHRGVDAVAAAFFAAGAAWLVIVSLRQPHHDDDADAAGHSQGRLSRWRIAGTAFAVIFVAEWGDITQLATANLAARYNPALVLAGALLGLWAATVIAVVAGSKSLRVIPMAWVSRIGGAIMLVLAAYSAMAAVR